MRWVLLLYFADQGAGGVLQCACINECNGVQSGAVEGVCDDGGPGAQTSLCALGTDAADCSCTNDRCRGDTSIMYDEVVPTPLTLDASRVMGAQRGAQLAARRRC